MKPWYRNSTLQMDDGEMQWLQSKDPASCAVWEWLKGDCQKRETDEVRTLSEPEKEMVCRKLGISLPTFSQISQNLHEVGWVAKGRVRSWSKWQERNRTPEEDALRKQVEYWRKKAESQEPPQILPKPPKPPQSEETRGDLNKNTPLSAPPTGNHAVFVKGWHDNFKEFFKTDYRMDGSKDGGAVKKLLTQGILVVDLLEVAKKSWAVARDNQYCRACKNSGTIFGFNRYFNDINVEISNATTNPSRNCGQASKSNPRNFGVCVSPATDYSVKPRAQREREEKERLAKEMATNGDNPPPDSGGSE